MDKVDLTTQPVEEDHIRSILGHKVDMYEIDPTLIIFFVFLEMDEIKAKEAFKKYGITLTIPCIDGTVLTIGE